MNIYHIPHIVHFSQMTHFETLSLYLLISFTSFTYLPTSLPWGNNLFVL